MTVFQCDGFETYGLKATAGATVQSNINATDKTTFTLVTGGHGGDVSLIDDFATIGLALEFPDLDAASGEFMTYEFPDGTGRHADYKLATDGAHPTLVTGFRLYNPLTMTPTQEVTIWQNLTGATTAQASLTVAANGVDLVFKPTSGGNTTISSALTQGAWHYIELEWKFAPGANGGFITVDVDGVQVANLASQNLSAFTFNTGYGIRIGVGGTGANQTAGENFAIDDVYQLEVDGVDHTGPLGGSGEVRVLLLSPTSDAIPNDWTPSVGGDNYALIDEQDWDTADYVEAATTADDDHYGITDLSDTATVEGLQIDVVCIATDGTPTLHIGFDDGTADEESMGVIGTGSTVQKRMLFEIDPSGSGWTESSANSVEATQRMTE